MSPPAVPASHTPTATLLQAADALLAWQLQTLRQGLATLEPAWLRQGLDGFGQHYLGSYRGLQLAEPLKGLLAASLDALLAQLTDLPLAPLRLPEDADRAVLGPAPWGIAALTRDPERPWDEEVALDVTVRYWQKARGTDLGLPDDFGEFYRAVEWVGLQQQLTRLGALAAGAPVAQAPDALARLLQGAHGAAERYRELKAIARALEQAEGVHPTVGFAYGRV